MEPGTRPGTIGIYAEPFVDAYIDGHKVLADGMRLPPRTVKGGKHTVKLVCDHGECPASGGTKVFEVHIDGDKKHCQWIFATGEGGCGE